MPIIALTLSSITQVKFENSDRKCQSLCSQLFKVYILKFSEVEVVAREHSVDEKESTNVYFDYFVAFKNVFSND